MQEKNKESMLNRETNEYSPFERRIRSFHASLVTDKIVKYQHIEIQVSG